MNNPTRMIRVLIVEDHFLARMALHSLLSKRSHIEIVGEAHDGAEALLKIQQLRPDVLLLDLRLPQVSGFDVLVHLRGIAPETRCVILSAYSGSEDIYRAIRAGALGYLAKDASGSEVLNAIESASRGMRYIPKAQLELLAERTPTTQLTSREVEVLTLITRGFSNKEIASALKIAEKTARIHVSSLLGKMGARDRTQATIYALQRGLVHLEGF